MALKSLLCLVAAILLLTLGDSYAAEEAKPEAQTLYAQILPPPVKSHTPAPPLAKPTPAPAPPLVKPPYTPTPPANPTPTPAPPLVKPPAPPPYTPSPPLVKPPSPSPPLVKPPYTPAPPFVKPPTPSPPVIKPPTPAPPVIKPPYTPSPPLIKPPYAPSPPVVKPPTPSPPLPPVRTRKDCIPLCGGRCKLHSRKNLCVRACMTCCDRCKCVPPGTYGNREKCGKCYTAMTTRRNRPKCP